MPVWRSEDNLLELLLSFYHEDLRDWNSGHQAFEDMLEFPLCHWLVLDVLHLILHQLSKATYLLFFLKQKDLLVS